VLVVTIALAVSTPSALHAQGASPIGVDGFVSLVLDQGLAAKLAASRSAEAGAAVDAAGLWPNPAIGLSRDHNVVGGRAGESDDQLSVSIPLVLSGRLGLEHEAAVGRAAAARASLDRARGTLRHEATAAYIGAVAARRRAEVIATALVALDEIARVVAAREEAGEAAGYDRARIELERARVQDEHRAAVADHASARATAARLSGKTVKDLPAFADALTPPQASDQAAELLASISKRRADLRALDLRAEAADRSADAAARRIFPDPVIKAAPTLQDLGSPTWGAGYSVGVSVPLPVFDRGQGTARVARARRDRLVVQRETLLASASARLPAAAAALDAQQEMLRRHDVDVVQRANELTTIVETAYRAGGATLLALVDAQHAQRQALLRSVDLTLRARLTDNDVRLLAGSYDETTGDTK
jgi:cobalt-zinc-cadmium efflux system outer membrane protein